MIANISDQMRVMARIKDSFHGDEPGSTRKLADDIHGLMWLYSFLSDQVRSPEATREKALGIVESQIKNLLPMLHGALSENLERLKREKENLDSLIKSMHWGV